MKTLNLHQGTPEWHAARLQHGTASEAPAMMGSSKYMSRTKLLDLKKTGVTEEVTPQQQRLYDKGHAAEASIRPVIEKLIGESLYPVTGSEEVDNIPLLASFDGITMLEDVVFEHKLWNADLAESVVNEDIDAHYYWQLEQQLLVSGAKKAIFVVSDGTEDLMRFMWYQPHPGRAEKLVAGWRQFFIDLEAHEVVAAETNTVVAEPVKDLPAVSVQVNGEISIKDNFKEFEEQLRLFVGERLITKPQTDQDFADLDAQIKVLAKAEAALDAVETSMLSQVQTISDLKRTKDMLHKLARDNRLMAEKLLKSEKEKRRAEILQRGKDALTAHISQINSTLGGEIAIPAITADFAGAMKGKRTIDSLTNAVSTTLAQAKIEADGIANVMRVNLAVIADLTTSGKALFADLQSIVTKPSDDFNNLVNSRVAQHHKAEQERLDAEREKIRMEEEEKARAKVKRQQDEAERTRLEEELKAQAKVEAEKAEADRQQREEAERLEVAQQEVIEEPAHPAEPATEEPQPAKQVQASNAKTVGSKRLPMTRKPETLQELYNEIVAQLEDSEIVTLTLPDGDSLHELLANIKEGINATRQNKRVA